MQRLEGEVKPAADRIMNALIEILKSVGSKSSVPDTVFATVGALSNALEEDFAKYMGLFAPFLYSALGNREEPGLCAMAIGLVSDITRSLGEFSQPYCDTFMNYLLGNLSVSSAEALLLLSMLTFGRTNRSATNSDRQFFKHLGILLRPLAHISKRTSLWLPKSCRRQPTSR